MESIKPENGGFRVRRQNRNDRTRALLLTIGRRRHTAQARCAGRELPKVVYRLCRTGADTASSMSGLRWAVDRAWKRRCLCRRAGTSVALSYRSEAFARVKEKNRKRLEEAQKTGRVQVTAQVECESDRNRAR